MFDKSKFNVVKEGSTAVLKYEDADAYTKGTDIPLETLEKIASYNKEYVTKATELADAEALKLFKEKGSKIEKVIAEYPFGHPRNGGVEVIIEKQHEFKNSFAKDKPDQPQSTIRPYHKVAVKDKSVSLSRDYLKKLSTRLQEELQK